jgi:type II secretory pathway component PulF
MIIYRYKAYDPKGKIHSGNLFVFSEEEAFSLLLRNNLTPLELKPLPQTFITNLFFKFFFKIKTQQKISLIRSLYLIMKSGLNLPQGLEILAKEAKGSLKDFIFILNYNLQRGEPFYQTFANFPHVFSQVEVETIKAGEISGNLVNNLEKLAENLERDRRIKNEVMSNLFYPVIVVLLSFGVIALLITFVMPKISLLLEELSANPPFFTRVLVSLSKFVNANLSFIIYLLILFFIALLIVFSIKKVRDLIFKFFISLPIISDIYYNFTLSQVFFVWRSLLSAGIPLSQVLVVVANTSPHPEVKKALVEIEKGLKEGKRLFDLLLSQPAIPIFVANILGVATESGFLEESLRLMEEYYLEEFRRKVRGVLNLIQPILLVFVGIIVGFVAIAVLVPIYQQISEQLQFQSQGKYPGEVR